VRKCEKREGKNLCSSCVSSQIISKYNKSCKGKSLEEIHGFEKAKKLKELNSRPLK
jgi:hypothetical protein